jgi:hypothetical protein
VNVCERTNPDKMLKAEHLDQIVSAILAGKYSWACVLILRFAGYNPLQYIPYRTYHRLERENRPARALAHQQHGSTHHEDLTSISARERQVPPIQAELSDLAYLEVLNERSAGVRGGKRTIGIKHLTAIVHSFFHPSLKTNR